MCPDEFGGGGAHGRDFKVAFSPLSVAVSLRAVYETNGSDCGREGRLCEEILVATFSAGEASGEVDGWGGTPGQDSDVGWEDAVEHVAVGEFIVDWVEG